VNLVRERGNTSTASGTADRYQRLGPAPLALNGCENPWVVWQLECYLHQRFVSDGFRNTHPVRRTSLVVRASFRPTGVRLGPWIHPKAIPIHVRANQTPLSLPAQPDQFSATVNHGTPPASSHRRYGEGVPRARYRRRITGPVNNLMATQRQLPKQVQRLNTSIQATFSSHRSASHL
jgi:hypothetical protein